MIRSFYTSILFFAVPVLMLTAAITGKLKAQDISVIPVPVTIQPEKGSFTLTPTTSILIRSGDPQVRKVAIYFSEKIQSSTGFNFKISQTGADDNIEFELFPTADARLSQEGYRLSVNDKKVKLTASTPAGLFYGVQTVLQLLPKEIESKTVVSPMKWQIPAVSITDYPRFGYRGIMLDVSRHFFSKEYVKEYIEQLARYKFNRLHLHLTDDNGWRVEIKSLPKLTQVGAWRVPRTGTFGSNEDPKPGEKPTYGGFYTQEDILEIVRFAKDRFIEIVPEIDVPGHSMAAIAAYPEFCVTKDPSIKVNPGTKFSTWFGNGKFEMHIDNTLNPADEKVYQFLDKVFTEIAAMFPYEYIHMGGDECYKGYWEKDTGVQAFMKKNNLKNGEELQSYFTKRVSQIITSKNKKAIGWDEILEGGIAPGAAVMSWRGTKGGVEATHLKHPVVMSPAPHYYLDMVQGEPSIEPPVYSTARLKEVYNFDILPAGIDSTYVMGAQGNLWTEQVPTEPQVEYMTYPRALAIAETVWSPESKKNWKTFTNNVEKHFERFETAGINYAPSIYDPIISVKKDKNGQLIIDLKTEIDGLDIFYTLDNSVPNHYHNRYNTTIAFPSGADMFRVVTYRNGKPAGRLITLKTEDLEKRAKK